MDKFTKGTLTVIVVFLGILVFSPLFWKQKVYVTNFPLTQTVDGYVSIRGEVERNDYPPVMVEIR